MDNYRIVPYLESKGLKCSQNGSNLIVAAEGTNLTNIQIVLSGEENFFGGYNYRAIFTTNVNIDINEKDKVISGIMEKYGPKEQSGFSFGCDGISSCDISVAGNSCVLTLVASMMAIDNKKPESYCYDLLLKGFIEKIDESSLIWKAHEAEKEAAKRRYEEYLIAHAGEIELLQARKQEIERRIVEIKEQNERIRRDALNVPAAQEYAEKQKECSMVEQELRGLGVFAFKRKKELQQKLEELNLEKSMLYNKELEQRKAVLVTQDESLPIKEKEISEIKKALKSIKRQAELDSGYTPTPKS